MRGRKPVPSAILKARGSWRGNPKRAGSGRQNEPLPDRTRPTRPRTMSADAKRVWAELAPQLDDIGVLTRIDGRALERYCELFAKWRLAMRTPGTDQLGWLLKLNDALMKLEREFGLTPSSRTRINAKPKEEKNDKEHYFRTG